ncbi:MAG: hypothetical protein HQK96_14115, partial [Nitrospirae bacterium]|nr:hypothetical protein [Nitrospirota bacterium]
MPVKYDMKEEFVDEELEQSLLKAIVVKPDIYWNILDSLPVGCFSRYY